MDPTLFNPKFYPGPDNADKFPGKEETWSLTREKGYHWYNAQADYALKNLGSGPGRCLVIGSPIFEALELAQVGWEVTYSDVRKPPVDFPGFILGDAAQTDYGIDIFDSASTTCVLCHAGLGRYGDIINNDADAQILENLYRALKPRAWAAVMFGPVFKKINFQRPEEQMRKHRVYTIVDAVFLARRFNVLRVDIFSGMESRWVERINDRKIMDCDYLSMVLEKP